MQLSGAEIMCRILAEEGVTTVFGYPGVRFSLFMMHYGKVRYNIY